MIGLSSAATCTCAALISFAPELWHKNKTPARLERAGAEKQCSEVTGRPSSLRESLKTSSIGLAIAFALLPSNKRPARCGFLIAASSTIKGSRVALFRNELRELLITICPAATSLQPNKNE